MSKTLLIMAAGTGGHVIPGLAVANTMRQRGWRVHWLGTRHGMENKLVPARQIEMTTVDFSGLRGKGLGHSLKGVFQLAAATLKSWHLLGQLRPHAVLGMGGYVTVPGGWAASLRRIPLVVVNSDAALLLSNKTLAKRAKRVLFGFAGRDAEAMADKAMVTGNPVRTEIAALPSPEQRYANRQGDLNLLVVGGSLGAKVLNDTLPQALALIPAASRPKVIHQSGMQHIDALKAAYQQAGVEAQIVPFIEDMAAAYSQADVMVCRAGAMTVSEIAAAGVASILVPFVASTTAHQRDNAIWMAEQGAAIHLPQHEMSAVRLANLLQSFDRQALLAMAMVARRLGKPDAVEAIADAIESVAR